jgi:hypothetical protein
VSAWNNPAPTDPIFIKCDISVFFENLLRKFKVHSNPTRIGGTLYEDQCTFLITFLPVLLRMRNGSHFSQFFLE